MGYGGPSLGKSHGNDWLGGWMVDGKELSVYQRCDGIVVWPWLKLSTVQYRVSHDLLVDSHQFLVRSHIFLVRSHDFLVVSQKFLVHMY